MGSTERLPVRHVPALDGLRGLALLGVLLFHANGALRGGYLGVDLFFVLSGYLITALLIAEHQAHGRIALGSFWVRRFRRLMPALLSLMPAVALYGRIFASPEALAGLRAEALATLGYVANWRAILSSKSYWDLFAAPSPLEHTWSLSIEEQFYVLWPPLVALLLRRGGRALLGATVALAALSVGAALALFDPAATSRVYLGTDTRAAGILAGAALAQVLPMTTTFGRGALRWLDGLGLLSVAGLALAWWRLDGNHPFLYRGGFWLTELGALVLIACAVAGPASLVGRALAARPLVWVGTLSYGLYLWHWPINVVLTAERLHFHGIRLHALRFALTFVVAMLSYRFLERPIRQRGLPLGRPALVTLSSVALCVALILLGTRPRPLPPAPVVAPVVSAEPVAFRLLILGDSTANSLGWVIRGVRAPGVAVELLGKDGCTMFGDLCGGPLWAQQTAELRPQATLLFLGGAFLHGLTLDGAWRTSCYPGWRDRFEEILARRLGELRAPGVQVWLATIPDPLGPYDSAEFRDRAACINGSIRKVAAAVEGVRILDIGGRLCPASGCVRESEGTLIRPDGVHYTMEGGAALARWLLARMREEGVGAGGPPE